MGVFVSFPRIFSVLGLIGLTSLMGIVGCKGDSKSADEIQKPRHPIPTVNPRQPTPTGSPDFDQMSLFPESSLLGCQFKAGREAYVCHKTFLESIELSTHEGVSLENINFSMNSTRPAELLASLYIYLIETLLNEPESGNWATRQLDDVGALVDETVAQVKGAVDQFYQYYEASGNSNEVLQLIKASDMEALTAAVVSLEEHNFFGTGSEFNSLMEKLKKLSAQAESIESLFLYPIAERCQNNGRSLNWASAVSQRQGMLKELTDVSPDGVKIAVIDTGFDHAGNTVNMESGISSQWAFDYPAYYAASDDLELTAEIERLWVDNKEVDENGHGTFIAGVIGAKDFGLSTLPVTVFRVVPPEGSQLSGPTNAMFREALLNACNSGHQVINLSWGNGLDEYGVPGFDSESSYAGVLEELLEEGCIVVKAAGNSGFRLYDESFQHPDFNLPRQNPLDRGIDDAMIRVASSTAQGDLALSSTIGDVIAPGQHVRGLFTSHQPNYGEKCSVGGTEATGGLSSGTSFAAPAVAAIAANAITVLKNHDKCAIYPLTGPLLVNLTERILKAASPAWNGAAIGQVQGVRAIKIAKAFCEQATLPSSAPTVAELNELLENLPQEDYCGTAVESRCLNLSESVAIKGCVARKIHKISVCRQKPDQFTQELEDLVYTYTKARNAELAHHYYLQLPKIDSSLKSGDEAFDRRAAMLYDIGNLYQFNWAVAQGGGASKDGYDYHVGKSLLVDQQLLLQPALGADWLAFQVGDWMTSIDFSDQLGKSRSRGGFQEVDAAVGILAQLVKNDPRMRDYTASVLQGLEVLGDHVRRMNLVAPIRLAERIYDDTAAFNLKRGLFDSALQREFNKTSSSYLPMEFKNHADGLSLRGRKKVSSSDLLGWFERNDQLSNQIRQLGVSDEGLDFGMPTFWSYMFFFHPELGAAGGMSQADFLLDTVRFYSAEHSAVWRPSPSLFAVAATGREFVGILSGGNIFSTGSFLDTLVEKIAEFMAGEGSEDAKQAIITDLERSNHPHLLRKTADFSGNHYLHHRRSLQIALNQEGASFYRMLAPLHFGYSGSPNVEPIFRTLYFDEEEVEPGSLDFTSLPRFSVLDSSPELIVFSGFSDLISDDMSGKNGNALMQEYFSRLLPADDSEFLKAFGFAESEAGLLYGLNALSTFVDTLVNTPDNDSLLEKLAADLSLTSDRVFELGDLINGIDEDDLQIDRERFLRAIGGLYSALIELEVRIASGQGPVN